MSWNRIDYMIFVVFRVLQRKVDLLPDFDITRDTCLSMETKLMRAESIPPFFLLYILARLASPFFLICYDGKLTILCSTSPSQVFSFFFRLSFRLKFSIF